MFTRMLTPRLNLHVSHAAGVVVVVVVVCVCVCGGGGGQLHPFSKPDRYVPPPRVWFLGLFGLKTCIDFFHFGLESGMVFDETRGANEHIYRFSSK